MEDGEYCDQLDHENLDIGSEFVHSPINIGSTPEDALRQMSYGQSINNSSTSNSEYSLSLEELRKRITSNKKLLFKHKIWMMLNYSRTHQADGKHFGLYWHDSMNFMCNTGLLAEFCKKKKNTINRNLRNDGFNIVGNDSPEKDWKMRRHYSNLFNINTTEDEMDLLPKPQKLDDESAVSDMIAPTTSSPVQPLPEKIHEDPIAENFKSDIEEIQRKIKATDIEKLAYLDQAIKDWHVISPYGDNVDHQLILELAADYYDNSNLQKSSSSEKEGIELNIQFLLENSVSSFTQQDRQVTFPVYYKFFLRFGQISNSFQNLLQVSHFSDQLTDIDATNFISQQSQGSSCSSFRRWFFPGTEMVKTYLEQSAYHTWAVKLSSTLNAFSFCKLIPSTGKIEFKHIIFSPIDTNNAFTLIDSGESFKSLPELLEKCFNVCTSN